MPTKRPRITVTFDADTYRQLKFISEKEGAHVGAVVRDLVENSLNAKVCAENIDFLSVIMREQINDIFRTYMNRIINLESKTCIQSGTAAYLCAEALSSFVPDKRKIDFIEAYEKSRKKAIIYMKSSTELDD